ncbi:MAG TPA: hypothetical protein VHG32_06050 [Thermoanaerobaculia bacterium]|nr:hypothetical protein [Thermoanaerobaculia bacterium]
MSDTCESAAPWWRVCPLRPDLSCLPAAYRGTRLATGIAVELQAPSGGWFPFRPCPPDTHWPAGAAGHRRLALALAGTRRLSHEVLALQDDLVRHLKRRFQCDRWELSAAQLERLLVTAAWEASGAADLDPAACR